MPLLPHKDDVERSLALAVRSLQAMGAVWIGVSAVEFGYLIGFVPWDLKNIATHLSAITVLSLGPGVIDLICASHVRQRHAWALTAGSVVAFLHMILFGGMVIVSIPGSMADGRIGVADVVFTLVALLFWAASVWMLAVLNHPHKAIYTAPAYKDRGFAPILPVEAISEDEATAETQRR